MTAVNCDVCGSTVEFLDDCDCASIMLENDWTDGPDSEAARAARGEGSTDAGARRRMWADLGKVLGELAPTPDQSHTPAVRRVVAWVSTVKRTGRTGQDVEPRPMATVLDAYMDAATIRAAADTPCAMRFRRRSGVGRRSMYTARVLARYAAYLRHRDEKAGHR